MKALCLVHLHPHHTIVLSSPPERSRKSAILSFTKPLLLVNYEKNCLARLDVLPLRFLKPNHRNVYSFRASSLLRGSGDAERNPSSTDLLTWSTEQDDIVDDEENGDYVDEEDEEEEGYMEEDEAEDEDDQYVEDYTEEAASTSEESSSQRLKNEGEGSSKPEDMIKVGVIIGAHGLKGELKVKSLTDFPEKRFMEPGARWIYKPSLRREKSFEKVYLTRGKFFPGKSPSWLIKLRGVKDRNQAEDFQGYSLFVPVDDKPKLNDGEFYSSDLIGLSVIKKDTGEDIGFVEDIFTAGVNELLRVALYKSPNSTSNPINDGDNDDEDSSQLKAQTQMESNDPSHKPKILLKPQSDSTQGDSQGSEFNTVEGRPQVVTSSDAEDDSKARDFEVIRYEKASMRYVWIPFVNDIVPEVNIFEKKIFVCPPPGLLDLNLIPEETKKKRKEKKLRMQEVKKKRHLRKIAKREQMKAINSNVANSTGDASTAENKAIDESQV